MYVAVTIHELFREAESGEDHPLTPQWGRLGDLVPAVPRRWPARRLRASAAPAYRRPAATAELTSR